MKNPTLYEQVSEWFVALLMISLLLFAFRDELWNDSAQSEIKILAFEVKKEQFTQLYPIATEVEKTTLLEE